MASQFGILAIWNDCRAGHEAEFEQWFQGEHLLERLEVPGFLFGRRDQAISGSSSYFNFYLVQSPDVLTSKPYLDRLDNPTPMTRKIMSEIFINMNRTICHRTVRRGSFRGAFAVTARFSDPIDGSEVPHQSCVQPSLLLFGQWLVRMIGRMDNVQGVACVGRSQKLDSHEPRDDVAVLWRNIDSLTTVSCPQPT